MLKDLAPKELGRGVIIGIDQAPPDGSGAPLVTIDQSTLIKAQPVVEQLHALWVSRSPVVIRLALTADELKAGARQTNTSAPWELGAEFEFDLQRLHFLVWNNNWDMRSGEPIWWWGKKAIALGASVADDGGDVMVDGRAVYCDGGPVEPVRVPTISYVNIQCRSLAVFGSAMSTADLAPDQSEAVHHSGGPARIIAPAGSGKTRVLTERLRHLITDWHLAPQAICAVAYNTRAASELTERTRGLSSNIRTLNSLALAIVNGTGGFLSSYLEASRRTMIDERDIRTILQKLVDLPRRTNSDPLAAWIEALSNVRLGLLDPAEVEDDGDLGGFADVFRRYRSHLDDNSLLDFDEQIYRAIEILLQDAQAREVAQQQCRLLLVDEFQDLTPAHMLMLRLLALPALDVFGVGDDDQVIYGYAGANPDYLVRFDKWFPGAKAHALEINYRCPPDVVTAASNMLTRNRVRVDKTIRARPSRQQARHELDTKRVDIDNLAETAIDHIRGKLDDGAPPEQIALLARVNVTLLPAQLILGQMGIPHNAAVDAALLKRTGIRTALAYLRIGANTERISRADITDTVRRPSRKISRNIVDMMTKRSHTSVSDLRRIAAVLTGSDGPRVDEYIQDLLFVSQAVQKKDTAHALEVIQDRVGLGEAMEALDGSRREADRSTHGDDLAALAAVAHLHKDAATFEQWLNKSLTNPERHDKGIELSTIHRVKGREWDHVIVYDVSEGLMPHRLSSDRSEERRVFHVAITRARKDVLILANKASASSFLPELDAPGEPDPIFKLAKEEPKEQRPDRPAVKPEDEKAFEALKQWRRATASDLKVPPYTIFHDSHLEAIAASKPTTLAQLSKCRGVGETKLDRWGDDILTLLDAVKT